MNWLYENSILFFTQNDVGWMLPRQASTYAPSVDYAFNVIFWISVFFFVLIIAVMTVFILMYRKRPGHEPQKSPSHNTALEITWTVIPLLIVVYLFYVGFTGYLNKFVVPANSYRIYVTAFKWAWAFQYPNGHVDPNLNIPKDRNVELIITSEDVTHSLYIPAFRLKMDAVPGRNHRVWFNATESGIYPLFCAEYCGTSHSEMIADVVVHETATDFQRWLEEASDFVDTMPLHEAGEKLYNIRGCATCHSVDGSKNHGPSYRMPDGIESVWGTMVPLEDGSEVPYDEDYVTESIYEPMAKIHAGYDPVMPTYRGKLKPKEVNAIIEFIKSLSPSYDPPEFIPPDQRQDEPEDQATGTE